MINLRLHLGNKELQKSLSAKIIKVMSTTNVYLALAERAEPYSIHTIKTNRNYSNTKNLSIGIRSLSVSTVSNY